jgi:hypothetical protein
VVYWDRWFVSCQYYKTPSLILYVSPQTHQSCYYYVTPLMTFVYKQARTVWDFRLVPQCTLKSGASGLLCTVNWLKFTDVVVHLSNTQVHHTQCTNPPHWHIYPWYTSPFLPGNTLSFQPSNWRIHISKQIASSHTSTSIYSSKPLVPHILLEAKWWDRQYLPKHQWILTSWWCATAQKHQVLT